MSGRLSSPVQSGRGSVAGGLRHPDRACLVLLPGLGGSRVAALMGTGAPLEKAPPAASRFLSSFVYTTTYTVSYMTIESQARIYPIVGIRNRVRGFPESKDAQSGIYFSSKPIDGALAGVEFMSNEAVITVGNDPLRSVADALDAAVQAAKGGVEDVRVTASGALPALGSFLSGLTYKSCYAVSYGVVFPAVLVARAIPQENAVVHGLIDGARAAIDMVNEMKAKSLSGEDPAASLPGHGTDTTP